jgi:tRNA A37 threonylcarbamoyladenosine biosynthesis protein TsaE
MYRVADTDDLESTGYYDYLTRDCVLAIEWSENIVAALPEAYWRVAITPLDDCTRNIAITKEAKT